MHSSSYIDVINENFDFWNFVYPSKNLLYLCLVNLVENPTDRYSSFSRDLSL